MKNLLKTLTTAAVLVPLLGAANAEERGRDFYADRIERASKIDVTLRTETRVASDDEPERHTHEGQGFVVGKYIFSKDHVTSRYHVPEYQFTPMGPRKINVPLDRETVISEQTFLDGIALFPVIEDKENDVSIFDLSKTPELCKTYCNDLTKDDLLLKKDLYRGMRVFWVGNPQGNEGFYKEGFISSKNSPFQTNTFMIQQELVAGTSGKPIWTESENPKIIGAADHVFSSMGGWSYMDNYVQAIEEYENVGKRIN